MENRLLSISPIDGRYNKETEDLKSYHNEYSFIRYRIIVEIEYLLTLNELDIFDKIDKDADLEVDWEEFLKFFVYEENEGDRGEQKPTSGIAEEANEDEEEKTEAVTTSTAKLELGESSTTTTTTDTTTDTTTTDTTVPVEIMTNTIDNITTEVEPSKEEPTKEEPTSG